jgi:hypothetical protein
MLSCFGGSLVGVKERYSRKSLELSVGGICPFNGIHVLCQRCRCKELRPSSPDRSLPFPPVLLSLLHLTAAAASPPHSLRCHIIHFAWIIPRLLRSPLKATPLERKKFPELIVPNQEYSDKFRQFLSKK